MGQRTAAAGGIGVAVLPFYIGDPHARPVRILPEQVTIPPENG